MRFRLMTSLVIATSLLLSFGFGMVTLRFKTFPYPLIEKLVLRTIGVGGSTPSPSDEDIYWANKIVSGGYILHFRHAQREKWIDVTAFDAIELKLGLDGELSTFSRATCLTDQGKEEAKLIGQVFKMSSVNISTVASSPSCRARQTAQLAFFRIDEVNNSLLHRTAIMPEQWEVFDKQLRNLILRIKILPGTNAILTGHVGTLSLDDGRIIDKNEVGDLDARDETGFLVLERTESGQIIARHSFKSIRFFTHAILTLPLHGSD